MIEFDGSIDSYAEKYFWNYSRRIVAIIMLFPLLILFPIFLIISINTKKWNLLIAYVAFWLLVYLCLLIPKSKKEKAKWAYRKIFIDGEYIVCKCLNENYEEFSLISDASELIDYGYFYHIKFPPQKASDKFICQKNLLVKGTLEEFEALFEGKIIRKIKQSSI